MGRKEASTMSVPQMALLLGIKKTDSYYLIKKKCFETTILNGQIRVIKKSFEEWYRNQTHYKKITGEEPGQALAETSYSISDLEARFGIRRTSVFDLLSRNYFPVIRIDSDTRRIPKEPFEAWLRTQEHYRDHDEKAADHAIEANSFTISMIAKILNLDRREAFFLVKNHPNDFETVKIAGVWRITEDSFLAWLNSQQEYRAVIDPEEIQPSSDLYVSDTAIPVIPPNKNTFTITEAATLMKLAEKDIYRMVIAEELPAIKIRNAIRISRDSILQWLTDHTEV